ncbi:MAG TPA: TCR/Tet family MFS transporter [Gammaproteobacteria bacterium]|nr:TCR/Tet family MFS transporter [Gammaproteobacteria bacterium]
MPSTRARLLVVLSVVYIDMLGIGLAFPILPKLVEQFEGGDISRASYIVGALAAAYSLAQFLCAPAIGALSDRFGRRPVILLALAGMAVNYLLLAFAPVLWLFAVGRMVAGAFGATFSAAGAYLADITPPEKRAQSFGLIGAAFGFGFITGPAIGGVLGGIDLRLPFLVAAGLSFADFAFTYFALPESLAAENRKPFAWRRANPVGALVELRRYGSVLGLIAVFVMAAFANRVAEMTWVLFTSYRFNWSTAETGFSLAMVGVMFVVGQGGLVRVLVPKLGERRAILMGLAVSAVVTTLCGVVPHGWMIYPVMVLAIFGWTIAQPAVQALMSRAVPADEQGLLQGALASMLNLTSIFGPPIWTGLFGYFVSPAAPVIVPGAAFFAAALVFLAAFVLAARWLPAVDRATATAGAASSAQP